jgi:hypothetical protein
MRLFLPCCGYLPLKEENMKVYDVFSVKWRCQDNFLWKHWLAISQMNWEVEFITLQIYNRQQYDN